MKILVLISSSMKKGAGATLARSFCDAFPTKKTEIEYVYLYDLNFKSCGDCDAHSDIEGFCSKRDDLVPVQQKMLAADLVVWSMPIYMDQICGTAKTFLDRFCIFVNPDMTVNRIPEKKFVLFITCGDPEIRHYRHVLKGLENLLSGFFKCEVMTSMIASIEMKAIGEFNQKYIKKAKSLGRKVAKQLFH